MLIALAILFGSLWFFFLLLSMAERVLQAIDTAVLKFLLMMLRSLRRNLLRTSLTYLAVYVLIMVVTLVWSVLSFLDLMTAEKNKDFKAIVTERWQVPSQMPMSYVEPISRGAARSSQDTVPQDYMTWQFYGATLDPTKMTRENTLFFFCMDPAKLRTMMDDLENLDEGLVRRLVENEQGILLGRDRMEALNKRVGDKIRVTSLNYKGINLEFEILGVFPDGRYNQSAVMNWNYLNRAVDAYRGPDGRAHPLDVKRLNIVWLKVPDSATFGRITQQIEHSSELSDPAVKCETASSGITAWLEAYRDLIWAMRWILSPAILITMSLVIANAISISVRERRTEMAVLKVLGFHPWQILALVLGEAILVGACSGFLSTSATFLYINYWLGGLKFPIAFFPAFLIPVESFWWGPVLGGLTSLAGSIVPALSARRVKVADVFARVA